MEIDLDILIAQWLDTYENGRLPRGRDPQIEAFMVLLKTLKDNGFERNGLSLVLSKAIRSIIPEGYKGKKASEWKGILTKLFYQAAGRIWPVEFSKLTEEEKNPVKIKAQDSAEEADINTSEVEEEYIRYGKELNDSIFSDIPAIDIQIDKEFSKVLGFESDE